MPRKTEKEDKSRKGKGFKSTGHLTAQGLVAQEGVRVGGKFKPEKPRKRTEAGRTKKSGKRVIKKTRRR